MKRFIYWGGEKNFRMVPKWEKDILKLLLRRSFMSLIWDLALWTASPRAAASDSLADVTDFMRYFRMAFEKLSQCEISFPKNAETVYVEDRIEIQEWSLPVLYLDHSSQVSSLSERNKSEENSQKQVLVGLGMFAIFAIELDHKIFFILLYLPLPGCMSYFCLKKWMFRYLLKFKFDFKSCFHFK